MTDTRILKTIYMVSALVFIIIVILFNLPKADHIPEWVKILPKLNAFLNGTCSILLIVSLICIKQKKISLHKKLNLLAFLISTLFLLSYVSFHAFGVETKYPLDNPWRPVYLIILISHILLAAFVLPLVLLSFFRGLQGQIEKHKKLTRWSFPIWLYVTITGVIVYLMISPYYNF